MNTIKTLLVTLVIILIASKESVGQWDIVPHKTVNPLRKDNVALPTAHQFGKDLEDGKTSAYLRISNVVYMTAATKAVNGSKAEARMFATTLPPSYVLHMYKNAVIKPRTLEQLEGVSVTGVKSDNAHFGMFPAFEAGDYGVFTDENGEEIILYKADCLNVCVDNRVTDSPLASLWSAPAKKQEAVMFVYNDNSITITDSYNTTTTTTTAPAWTPAAPAQVASQPAQASPSCDRTVYVQGCSGGDKIMVLNPGGGNSTLNTLIGVTGMVATTAIATRQNNCRIVQQPHYPQYPQHSGPTWTDFNPPPVGGEGYGGGSYYGPSATVPIGGDGGYGGGGYTGFN